VKPLVRHLPIEIGPFEIAHIMLCNITG